MAKRAPAILCSLLLLTSFLLPAHSASQELFQAIQSGDRERVEALVAEDPGVLDVAGPRGMMPVDLAFFMDCQRGSDLAALLISKGAAFDPNASLLGRPKLLVAIPFGRVELVRFLLEGGADPNASGPTGTALHDSARRGQDDIVSLLLEAGANVDALDPAGAPPLRWAVDRGHLGVVELLLAAGAALDYVGPEDGMTLLHHAALAGHLGMLDPLLDQGLQVSPRDSAGNTPLHYAARYGHAKVVDRLLSAGARPSEDTVEHTHPSPHLEGGIGDGEAALWYLNHRGLTLKTSGHLLVFDPEEFGVTRPTEPGLANGFLVPEEIGGEDVLVFYSAYHGYVDEPAYVHTIADSLRSVTYVHNAGDEFRGSDRAVFLSPRMQEEVGDVRFTTLGPTVSMSTLGYLIDVDGLLLCYQGFGADDLEHYRAEMEFLGNALAGRNIDVAFLPIPDRGAEGARGYLRIFFDSFQPETVAIHTPPAQLRILPRAAEIIEELGYQGRIVYGVHPGDAFLIGR